jgi:hypothetical protein
LNVASGKGYQINQTEVLNATTLGSNVVSSSLTSVGTLSALTVGGSIISNYGEIKRNADNSNFAITGGTASNSGGNLVIYGANHSSLQNVVRIRQGSTDRIYITSDGKGGSTYPGGHLKLYGGSGDDKIEFCTSGSSASSSVKMTLKGDGKLGIGTDNPSDKLSIFADPNSLVIGAKDTTRGNHIFQLLADDAGGNGELRLYRHSASGTHEKVVEITSSGNSYFNGGNIGIGTDSPEEILHVAAASETVNSRDGVLFQSTSALAADTGLPIVFTSNVGTDSNYGVASIAGRKENANSGEAQGYLQFSTGNRPGTITEKVRITSDGKVGIGSISPAQLLDIASTAPNIRFTDTADGHSEIDGNAAELKFNADKGNTKADSKITFFVDNDEKVRITSDGKIGINESSPDATLEINSGSTATALDIRGSAGQLFSVTNSLSSGSIFSVNDISGVPSIDVDADGTIQLAPFGGTVELYYNGTKRFETNSVGVIITGLIGLGGANNYGTSGQVLTSNGSQLSPTWQDAASGGGGGEFSLSGTGKAIHSSAAGNSSSASHSFFVGTNAGNNNITGGCNNLIGCRAGCSLTSGRDNNFFGDSSGTDTTTGEFNNFMGAAAGRYNTTGCHNNFFGANAGKSDAFAAGTGCHNNFFGCDAGRFITTGKFNNYIGISAGCSGDNGCCNNFIGRSAGKGAAGNNNNFFGSYAGCRNSGSHNNFIGEKAGKLNCDAGFNNYIGRYAGCGNITGSFNNYIGRYAGCAFCCGSNNNFIGHGAGRSTTSQGNGQGTGSNNNFFGCDAGFKTTSGCHNNFFGMNAGRNNTTGSNNVFIGCSAGCRNTTASHNVFVGQGTGGFVCTNACNTAVGRWSGYYLSGARNTFLGARSGKQFTSGSDNVSIGYYAGGSPGGGYYSFQTGSYNITIGSLSCTSNTTVSNEVSIFNNCKTARFQGNATAWSFVSDEREKKNIIDLPLGGDFLSKLRPRKFEWKSEDEDSHEQASGFVAQEVLEVVEEYNAHYTGLVDTNDPNQYTFAAAALIPMIVNAIQELRQELEQVKSRIDTLESS